MLKIIYPVLLLLIYVFTIVFSYNRYKTIKRNPKKYDIVPGYDKYKESEWFSKTNPVFGTGRIIDGITVAVGLILFVSVSVLPDIIAKGNNATIVIGFFWSKWSLLSGTVGIAFSIFLGFFIPMFSKKPSYIAVNLHYVFKGKRRSLAWRKMLLLAIVFCTLMIPMHILSVLNYGYADNERVVYSPFFSLKEQVFEYDDIQSTKVIYSEDGKIIKHYFIYNSNGECFDVYEGHGTFPEVSEQIADNVITK